MKTRQCTIRNVIGATAFEFFSTNEKITLYKKVSHILSYKGIAYNF